MTKPRPLVDVARRRVVLEREVRTPDNGGGATISYTTVATLYADVGPVDGTEDYIAARLRNVVTHEFRIRDGDDLVPSHRFRIGTRTFEIHAMLRYGMLRPFLRCLCRETTP
jgi:SPP1 family predicted phage head-tail adaptor